MAADAQSAASIATLPWEAMVPISGTHHALGHQRCMEVNEPISPGLSIAL